MINNLFFFYKIYFRVIRNISFVPKRGNSIERLNFGFRKVPSNRIRWRCGLLRPRTCLDPSSMPIVSRCIIARSVKHRARTFLAKVKAKDEGAKETANDVRTAVGAVRGTNQWRRISLVRMRDAFRDLLGCWPLRLVGLSRPRHSVRDTIRCGRVVCPFYWTTLRRPRRSQVDTRPLSSVDREQKLPPSTEPLVNGRDSVVLGDIVLRSNHPWHNWTPLILRKSKRELLGKKSFLQAHLAIKRIFA